MKNAMFKAVHACAAGGQIAEEGSPEEEAGESPAFEAQEDAQQRAGQLNGVATGLKKKKKHKKKHKK